MQAKREYGIAGWGGIGAPQAKPKVEMEMRRLLAPDVEPLTTRLTSQAASADGREGVAAFLDKRPPKFARSVHQSHTKVRVFATLMSMCAVKKRRRSN